MDEIRTRLEELLQGESAVCLAYLFGSQARGEAAEHSDLDVAVLTDPALGPLELGALAERLGASFPGRAIDLLDLRAAPPLLRYEVVREGVPLVCRDPDAQFRFERDAFHRAEDTRHLREVQQKLLREAAGDGRPT